MTKYKIVATEDYEKDLDTLYQVIAIGYKSPITAKRYLAGLMYTVEELELIAGALPYCQNRYVIEKYGVFTKRLNYKNVAILFEVENDVVFILRILPQSIIY